jgi:hypothetical protein
MPEDRTGTGSGQVDRRRDGDGQRHAGVSVIALEREDENGDQACQHGREPSDAGEIHVPILAIPGDGGTLEARREGS